MTTEYRVLSYPDAKAQGAPHPWGVWEDEDEGYEFDERNGVWRFEDGQPVECIGTDGGEPEDNTLRRDWGWIPAALQAAYNLGQTQATK